MSDILRFSDYEYSIRRQCEKAFYTSYEKGQGTGKQEIISTYFKRLYLLELQCCLRQKSIQCACFGNIAVFLNKIVEYIYPMIKNLKKDIRLHTSSIQNTFFSPRIMEVCFFAMLNIGLCEKNCVEISISQIHDNISACFDISNSLTSDSSSELRAISHVSRLHNGRSLIFYENENRRLCFFIPVNSVIFPPYRVPCEPQISGLLRLYFR